MNETDDAERGAGGVERGRWNPYLVGIGIGVLSWLPSVWSISPWEYPRPFRRFRGSALRR